MHRNSATATDALESALRASDPAGCEMSLIELVLFACDVSEDATEIGDVVDGLIERGAARVLPIESDGMLTGA